MLTQPQGRPRRYNARRGDVNDVECPSRTVLNHVTSRWGLLILIHLLDRTHRFSELARGIGGVSEKMLAQSLQALEADGFISRTVHPTVPPKVEYSLTGLGREVALHVRTLTDWVEEHLAEVLRLQVRGAAKREAFRAGDEKSRRSRVAVTS